MTLFHLLRHGEHALAGRILPGRLAGVGLSAKGQEEAALAALRLETEGIEALYSSPLERTRETAAIVASTLKLPLSFREDLIEIDYGNWTGKRIEEIKADPLWQEWRERRAFARVPGGESMREVQNRVLDALFDLRARHRGGRVLLVSHGDVIRAALLYALGLPLDLYARIEVGIGSLSTLSFEESGMRVLLLNERPRKKRQAP